MLLNAQNYKNGFLVDDEVIGGITEMDGGLFAAYISHYLTGETYAYQEFAQIDGALQYLASVPRAWVFESVGCSKIAKKTDCGGGCSCG